MLIKSSRPADGRPPLFAIAILSATALAYEVLLIRLFSIVQWHHFAYMIISLALLGYGASGTFLSLTQTRLLPHYRLVFITHLALFGVSLLPCFLLAQAISFNPEEMLWDWRQTWRLTPVYLLLSLPFFFAANAIALSFVRYRTLIDRIYATDLFGAGAGSLLVVLLLYSLQPLEALTVLSICGLGCISFAAFDLSVQKRIPLVALTLGLIAAVVWLGTQSSLTPSPYKDLSQSLRIGGADMLAERSSPIALLNVVDNRQIPQRYAPGMSINSVNTPPSQLSLFADGNAIGAITDAGGTRQSMDFLDQLLSALPYHLKPAGRVLVLGSGDGMEILQALHQGADRVEAVELDPQLVELIDEEFGGFSGRIYRHPRLKLHIDEARGFVSSGDRRYDLLVLPPHDGVSGGSAGLYALNENYLYTVEAIEGYLDSLNKDSYLALEQWIQLPPRNSLRLLATAIQALRQQGIAEPADHLALIRGWQTSILVIKNTPFSPEELSRLRSFCETRAFDLAWLPGLRENETNRFNKLHQPEFFHAAKQLLGKAGGDFIDRYKFDIRPAYDDRPYFANFFKWSSIGEMLALREKGGMGLVDAGYPVLLLTLVQALMFSAVLILLPLLVFRKSALQTAGGGLFRVTVYFTAIGLAFLFIEIAFIQKFMLFLYHPVVTVSVILAAFLVFAGAGSLWCQRLLSGERSASMIVVSTAAIILLSLIYLATLDSLFAWSGGLPLAARISLSIILIAPLAFFMGMPFPLALSYMGRKNPRLLPFAWGVNGCASVLSAVLATLLAVHFGFTRVVLLALGCYLLAAFTWSAGRTVR